MSGMNAHSPSPVIATPETLSTTAEPDNTEGRAQGLAPGHKDLNNHEILHNDKHIDKYRECSSHDPEHDDPLEVTENRHLPGLNAPSRRSSSLQQRSPDQFQVIAAKRTVNNTPCTDACYGELARSDNSDSLIAGKKKQPQDCVLRQATTNEAIQADHSTDCTVNDLFTSAPRFCVDFSCHQKAICQIVSFLHVAVILSGRMEHCANCLYCGLGSRYRARKRKDNSVIKTNRHATKKPCFAHRLLPMVITRARLPGNK